VRNKFAEKVKNTFYGRRDAAVKPVGDVGIGRATSNNEENIARLLAAATCTSDELALLKQSPDYKILAPSSNGISCLRSTSKLLLSCLLNFSKE